MIPQGIQLFTWVDVEDVLLHVRENRGWPEWLKSAQAYWEQLTLEIAPGKRAEAMTWLADTFDPRFVRNMEEPSILLESLEDTPRQLEIQIEENEDEPLQRGFIPSLSRPSTLTPCKVQAEPESFPKDCPPLIALHSFKGGVGRTIHAVAIARSIADATAQKPVLLIDGDLEAPGITWLLKKRLLNPPISFIDFLALIQGDPDPATESTLRLIADRIKSSPQLDHIYMLPAFRLKTQFTSLQIRPEHLVQAADDPYIITSTLSKLGKMLGIGAVVIDLRAGISEFSTGILLDPRVHRILVTTLSAQSVEGTEYILELFERLTPPRPGYPLPKVIFSQIPDAYMKEKASMAYQIKRIENSAQAFWKTDSSEHESKSLNHILKTVQEQRLMVLPELWDEFMGLVKNSELFSSIEEWIDWIPVSESSDAIYDIGPDKLKDKRKWIAMLISLLRELIRRDLRTLRKHLVERTESMIYSESGKTEDFLPYGPIRHLINDFQKKLPIALILGKEGTGKTFMFLQIIRRRQWRVFASDAGLKETEIIDAECYPVTYPGSFSENAKRIVVNTENLIKDNFKLPEVFKQEELKSEITKGLEAALDSAQWRELWLDMIAWRMGFCVRQTNAGRRFLQYLQERKKRVIAVLDGVEDFFRFQDTQLKSNGKKALQALLRDIPFWLEQGPGCRLGILIFTRRDMAGDAVRQNQSELMARYAPYEFKWTPDEALRLALWVFRKTLYPETSDISELLDFRRSELAKALIPFFGKKLSTENSHEIRSEQFIIDVLSDLEGHVRAENMVWFICKAARNSIEDTQWETSLLTPDAIQKTEKEYVMELAKKQEMKLRLLSDDELYEDAVAFIKENGTIKNHQINGLKNIADAADGFSHILKFTRHQASKTYRDTKDFYAALTKKLETLQQRLKTDQDFVPDNLSRKELSKYSESYGLLIAREFINHLWAENTFKSEKEQ